VTCSEDRFVGTVVPSPQELPSLPPLPLVEVGDELGGPGGRAG
jgi:hypothetical protein